MKRIAICDDHKLDRELLKVIINNYFEMNEEEYSVYEYASGDSLLVDLEEGFVDVDIIFLDIIMKGTNGMDVARKVRDIHMDTPIVFLTASSRYAVESYEVHASGYLVKPFDVNKLTALLSEMFQKNIQKSITIKIKRRYYSINLDTIMYIESDKHVLHLYLNNGENLTTTEKLNDLENKIHSKRYIRCHQSYLVNMDFIKEVKDCFVLKDDTSIPIRARGRKQIISQYEQYRHSTL